LVETKKYNGDWSCFNGENNSFYDNTNNNKYWNKTVYEHPEALNFWFDFLDTQGELQ
jgi:hypothetical protein